MKSKIAIILVACSCSVSAQTFTNLNFEAANPVSAGNGYPGFYVTPASALPGWSAYYGSTQQSAIPYNAVSLGAVNISLLNAANGAINGNYSVLLQGGEGNGGPAAASISQMGLIPAGTETLYFKGESGNDPLNVSIDNQNVSYVAIQTEPEYTLYAANISAWADTTELFTFSAPSLSGETDNWKLDDIAFSQIAVPEPSPLILTGIGGSLLALQRRFAAERQ